MLVPGVFFISASPKIHINVCSMGGGTGGSGGCGSGLVVGGLGTTTRLSVLLK